MKFAESWLREWVDPPISTEELAHRLTMAGHEVDGDLYFATSIDSAKVKRTMARAGARNWAKPGRICVNQPWTGV